jgi:exonuclease III
MSTTALPYAHLGDALATDYFQVREQFTDEQWEHFIATRRFVDQEVLPAINEYWEAAELPWPERLLICAVDGTEVINLHSPIAPAPELAKIRTHEALAAFLSALEPAPRILCGDLNTPRREFEGGEVLTFAHDTKGRLRPERGERWDRAERALIRDLGWTDAFRALHGYAHREASWTFKDDRGGWRLDHVLLSELRPVAAAYGHEWRRAGLSDHAPLIVDVSR